MAKDVKEPMPFLPWAKAEYDVRASGAKWLRGAGRELPAAGRAEGAVCAGAVAHRPDAEHHLLRARSVQSLVAGVHGRSSIRRGPRQLTNVARLLDGQVGRRHARGGQRGFNGRVWLDQLGKPSTEALHVTTRLTRKDSGTWTFRPRSTIQGLHEALGRRGRRAALVPDRRTDGVHLPREREGHQAEVGGVRCANSMLPAFPGTHAQSPAATVQPRPLAVRMVAACIATTSHLLGRWPPRLWGPDVAAHLRRARVNDSIEREGVHERPPLPSRAADY